MAESENSKEDIYSRTWDSTWEFSDSEETSVSRERFPNSFPKKKKLSSFRRRKNAFQRPDEENKEGVDPNPIEMRPLNTKCFVDVGSNASGMTKESSEGGHEEPVSPVCSDSKTSEESTSPRRLYDENLNPPVDDDEEIVPGLPLNPVKENQLASPATARLIQFFFSQESAYCENIRKIHELMGLYVMNQQDYLCPETSIIFPDVIETFLKKMCDFSTGLPHIWNQESADPFVAVLECCVENLRDIADEHVLYATTYADSRDKAFDFLHNDIEFYSLCDHKSREWEKYDDRAQSPNLLDLLFEPIIRPTQQIAFFETLSRKLDSHDPKKHELIMKVMEILQHTEEDICKALKVNSVEEVDSRSKEATESIFQRGRMGSFPRFDRNNSQTGILPNGVAEPRMRKNTDWDILGSSYSVKKGHFYKLSRRGKVKLYCFWLFNDVLLYGYDKNFVWKTRKGLSIDKNFCVNSVQHGDYPNALEIHSSTKSFVAFTATAEEKVSWLEAFNSVQWKALYDPPPVESKPKRRRMSSRCDTCEMSGCTNSLNGMLGFFQKYYCGFCGKCICSDCGRYSLPYPKERKDQRACVRCYYKVMKYPRLQRHSHLFTPGHYLAIKDRIPVRRLDSVASDTLPMIRQGDIVHVTECRYASARILSPRSGYIPLTLDGHKVLCDWDIRSWTNDLVCQFVKNIDLPQYVDKFEQLKIQGEDLYSMSQGDLDKSLLEDFKIDEHILRFRFMRVFTRLKEAYERLRHTYNSDFEYENMSECGESRSSLCIDNAEEINVVENPADLENRQFGEGLPRRETSRADMILGRVPLDV